MTWGEVEGDGTSVSVNQQCTTPVVAVRTRNHVEFFDLRALETLAEQLVSARDHVRGLERAARNPETFKALSEAESQLANATTMEIPTVS